MTSTPTDAPTAALLKTPLHDLHVAAGARMVPFAGYDMPVQYDGIIAEHQHTRAAAGLFDVSHMGQLYLVGPDHATTAAALETLVPADILNLPPGRQRYTQFTNAAGGILDDLMVFRSAEPADDGSLFLVVNAARKAEDMAHLAASLPANIRMVPVPDRALIAIQGPKAVDVLVRAGAPVADWPFMSGGPVAIAGIDSHVSRSGYTGEDGFEISVAADHAAELWQALTADPDVRPVGLGARDSLRLEAGLCLYGHDMDETVTPVEAGLTWSIQKRRREGGGFPGADVVRRQLSEGPPRIRVGIRPAGRAPAREGTGIVSVDGRSIGTVTSGGFGPTVGGPVAMGLVDAAFASPGTALQLMVRGRPLDAEVAPLPFVAARFFRGKN
jgi:aminomethyltransferase